MEDQSSGDRPPRRELQGPRPTPLKVKKDYHKIKKPPIPPPSHHHQPPPHHHQPPRPPIIIYAVSPKVIHTNPSDFMTLVQRLTGPTTTTSHPPPPSPAARFAAIEKTKIPPQTKTLTDVTTGYEHLFGTRPGGGGTSVLSPGPSGLTRPVPPAFFSDPIISPLVSLYHQHQQDHFNALQQIQFSGGGGVLPSPSPAAAFLSPMAMLSPASIEFLTRLLDQ